MTGAVTLCDHPLSCAENLRQFPNTYSLRPQPPHPINLNGLKLTKVEFKVVGMARNVYPKMIDILDEIVGGSNDGGQLKEK